MLLDPFTLPDCYWLLECPAQRLIRAVALANYAGHGATQDELATELGYSQQSISRLVAVQVKAGTLRLYQTGPWLLVYIARPAAAGYLEEPV